MKKYLTKRNIYEIALLVSIVLLASYFRFTGTNWDNYAHLHPDERYMTMVAIAVEWPKDFDQYLDPQTSPLSPYNKEFGSYIYGTFPLFFVKYVADSLGMGDYNQLHLVGRTISGVIDIGNLVLIYLIGNNIYKKRLGLVAALFYAVAVMPIQQSHFFTTDTYETFFVLTTFLLLIIFLKVRSPMTNVFLSILIGISMGLALASKISAAVFGLMIGVALGMKFLQQIKRFSLSRNIFYVVDFALLILITIYVVFRLASPYIFENASWFDITLNPDFENALNFQRTAITGEIMFPPQYNWVDTTPYLFPFSNIMIWGLGIPLGVTSIVGLLLFVYEMIHFLKYHYHFKQLLIPLTSPLLIAFIWVIGDFIYRGGNFIKSFRYLLAILPFLMIFASLCFYYLKKFNKNVFYIVLIAVFVPTLLWAYAFTSIYTRTTTRIEASEWIYENVPPSKTIANEHWDDAIPFRSAGPAPAEYPNRVDLEVYIPDDQSKIPYLYNKLEKTDYIFITSDRARKNIGELPELFPIMVNYYKALDEGTLGYEPVEVISSYPEIFGIEINDSEAEETFWVYDHPTVRIYEKVRQLDEAEFSCILKPGNNVWNGRFCDERSN
jgi:hypothetical protein